MHFPSAESAHVRPARPADVESMARIEQDVFSDPWPMAAFADMLPALHARVMVASSVASSGEDVLGYCVLLRAADEGEIANIAVAPGARRRGIAGELLDDALQAAAHSGVQSVYLEVRVSNDAARKLYASRSFIAVGRRRAYYRNPLEDALVLRWTRPAPE